MKKNLLIIICIVIIIISIIIGNYYNYKAKQTELKEYNLQYEVYRRTIKQGKYLHLTKYR